VDPLVHLDKLESLGLGEHLEIQAAVGHPDLLDKPELQVLMVRQVCQDQMEVLVPRVIPVLLDTLVRLEILAQPAPVDRMDYLEPQDQTVCLDHLVLLEPMDQPEQREMLV